MRLRITTCKKCHRKIVFQLTASGHNMPVNFEEGMDYSLGFFDSKKMVSHFETCDDTVSLLKRKTNSKNSAKKKAICGSITKRGDDENFKINN